LLNISSTRPLKVGNSLHDHHHDAQVARCWLTARDEVRAIFVDADFHGVDAVIVG
jgi:hypothetical protein